MLQVNPWDLNSSGVLPWIKSSPAPLMLQVQHWQQLKGAGVAAAKGSRTWHDKWRTNMAIIWCCAFCLTPERVKEHPEHRGGLIRICRGIIIWEKWGFEQIISFPPSQLMHSSLILPLSLSLILGYLPEVVGPALYISALHGPRSLLAHSTWHNVTAAHIRVGHF